MARRHVLLPEDAMKVRGMESSRSAPLHHLEDRIVIQRSEIQSLLVENQRLSATHIALKQELSAANQDLRQLALTAAEMKAKRDVAVREVYEKSLKVDAEARLVDAMMAELNQVRAEVDKLITVRKQLTNELATVDNNLLKAKAETKEANAIEAEIETLRREIQRGRAAVELEKKNSASNQEYGQAMEKSMVSMAHQIERLRAELTNAEKKARAVAAANPSSGYAVHYGSSELDFGANPYPNPYAMHQVQGGVDVGYHYASGVAQIQNSQIETQKQNSEIETQTTNYQPSTTT